MWRGTGSWGFASVGGFDSVPEVRRDSDQRRGVRTGISLFEMRFRFRKGEQKGIYELCAGFEWDPVVEDEFVSVRWLKNEVTHELHEADC